MSGIHLNDLSKIYREQIVEKKDDSYLEPDMKKRQKNNEKARKDMEKMGTSMKNPHFEEVEVDEAMSSYDRNRKRAAQRAADRNAARAAGKTGVVPGVGYVSPRKERETYVDSAGTTRHKSGAKMEGLDPVGKEDGDVNNDGKKDSTDSYLMKRRKAIGKAIKGKMRKEETDADKYIEAVAKAKEAERTNDVQRWVQKESFSSNWRQDLSEIMTDDIDSKPIKEKKVNNKIKINPKLGEAVEEIGGEILEMTEVKEGDKYDDLGKQAGRMNLLNNPKPPSDPKKTAEKKARLEKKHGMKLDDHPQYRKEEASMTPQELQLQKRKAMLDRMIAQKRQQGLNKAKKSEPPTKAMGEEVECAHNMKGKECPVHGKKDCSSMDEATEDSLKDRRMERGGVGGNQRYNKPVSNTPNTFGKKKPKYDGMSALEKVKANIRAKHGQGAIMNTKKK